MRWIYISPHFDDAVLSCGGLIWEQTHSGIPVEIWTVNAGDPPPGPVSDLITRVHAMWHTGTPQQTVQQRRIEDQNAANQVGATLRQFKMVDAIYRRNNTGSLIYAQDVFEPIHPGETGIIEETSNQIAEGLLTSDTVVCPLALGGHVDHIITRRAIEILRPPGSPLQYYADIPYLFRHEMESTHKFSNELAPETEGLRVDRFFISNPGLVAWQAAIAEHASQISSLFVDLDDMRSQIKSYCLSRNGLNLWQRV